MSRRDDGRSPLRRRILLGIWLLTAAVIVGRAAQIQVVQRAEWQERADRQHRTTSEVAATRGRILDRHGTPLAISQERLRVSVAPHEVLEKERTAAELAEVLGLSESEVQRAVRSDRSWVVLQGQFPPSAQSRIAGLRGIYTERTYTRLLPSGSLVAGVVGRVVDGTGAGGIEQHFDDVLAGTPGRQVGRRDATGNPIPGASWLIEEPVPGGDVTLTLDLNLQEIAHEALLGAMDETGARGGDLIITDPRTGEILAAVSLGEDRKPVLSAIHVPYEPGSAIKPFIMSGLVDRGRLSLADTVDTGDGVYEIEGRVLHDVSRKGRITFAEVLRYSSNVGMAKGAQAYEPLELYETLRDFGFGVATGVPLPGEQAGRLRHVDTWSRQSQASLSIGYELGVTPLQMAMAYGSLANGGRLMEARLVRQVRDAYGDQISAPRARAIRRTMSGRTARQITQALIGVVEAGSGTRARIHTFQVAGKSGTARAWGPGGYVPGEYFSSFGGFFPADDPRLVLFVKLDRPKGRYYGGATAAPVTRAALEAILAASRGPLDADLLNASRRATQPAPTLPARFAGLGAQTDAVSEDGTETSDLTWSDLDIPMPPEPVTPAPAGMQLPDLTGMPARVAVRRLHAYGFRVEWEGDGPVQTTVPAPGTWRRPGEVVRVLSGSK